MYYMCPRVYSKNMGYRHKWRTPPELFRTLNSIFKFTVDACADGGNHLCPLYWSEQNDCRKQDWSKHRVFCNPPFGSPGSIISKAKTAKLAVVILPTRALTASYFLASEPKLLIIPKGRIKFLPPPELRGSRQNPECGSVIVFYGELVPRQAAELMKEGWGVSWLL